MQTAILRTISVFMITAISVFGLAATTEARVSQQEASQLGHRLTPFGAIASGNSSGTIPSIGDQASRTAGGTLNFLITSQNMAQHRDHLTAGQAHMLQNYPGYELHILPSQRHRCYPSHIEEASVNNARQTALSRDEQEIVNYEAGVPFPIAKSGLEAILNHARRPRPPKMTFDLERNSVTRAGNSTQYEYKIAAMFTDQYLMERTETQKPARAAGFRSLQLTNSADRSLFRHAVFNPGKQKVERIPPNLLSPSSPRGDGSATLDSKEGYRGLRRDWQIYDWALTSKTPQEKYIQYSAELNRHNNRELIEAQRPTPQMMPYELHRVHTVEAKLKPDQRHVYARRVFYLDEDSWLVAASEAYDGRGELWRYQESPIGFYSNGTSGSWCLNAGDIVFDLNSRRYLIERKRNIRTHAPEITEEMFSRRSLTNGMLVQ